MFNADFFCRNTSDARDRMGANVALDDDMGGVLQSGNFFAAYG